MASTAPTTTRRALLGTIALTTTAAAVPALAMAADATQIDRSAWDAAMATYLRAKAASDAMDEPMNTLAANYEAGRPSLDMIDWREFPFRDRHHVARSIDIEAEYQAFVAAEGKTWWGDAEKMKAKKRAAYDTVQAYRDAWQANDDRWKYTATNARYDASVDAMVDAAWVLIRLPAPDGEALNWKTDYLFRQAEADAEGYLPAYSSESVSQYFADIRRLAGGQA